MAFNLTTAKNSVRRSIRDTVEPYRFDDNEITDWIYEAQAEIMRRSPHSAPAGSTISSTPLISQAYMGAITTYAAARALLDDTEEGSTDRALAFMKMFETLTSGF